MNKNSLINNIKRKKSFLCIGLDSDINKIPKHLHVKGDPVFEFNKAIIDATHDLAIAYKPNIAFYESRGSEGWNSLRKTIEYLKQYDKEILTIADAKRGDIGNTSRQYAKTFLEYLNFDAITVAPYMGEDSVTPFLEYEDKWVILLALTSNKGALDFQMMSDKDDGLHLFEKVLNISQKWGNPENMMYVVGATQAEMLQTVRKHVPNHFLLVPGIGAQGGDLKEVVKNGMNRDCGLIVNSSRDIIFADNTELFAETAREKAKKMQALMESLLVEYNF